MESLRSLAIRSAANQADLVKRFGHVHSLEIDPTNRELFISILLHGESEPIQAKIHYRLDENGGSRILTITEAETSRSWLNEVIKLFQEKQRSPTLPLTGFWGKLVSMIL
ncbi:MAG TPA: hypothetical protein VLM37_06595 [Fibrobacteraceae bacterium]|nr:hypothetical protein [Fibrobacteraceae bacterium]